MARGCFITIEGGEGTGKSTQVLRLAERLIADGRTVVATREPGGSPGADRIRELLVQGSTDRWDAHTELLLHFAARRDHLVRTVWPALDAGKWVISDRFADSTMAYQGHGHQLGRAAVEQMYTLVVGDFRPDLTVILDLPVNLGLERATQRGDDENRYEKMGVDFHQRLRDGFLDIAKREPQRCVVIDARGTVDEVTARVLEAVLGRVS